MDYASELTAKHLSYLVEYPRDSVARDRMAIAIEGAVREALLEAAVLCEADGLTGIRLGAAIRALGAKP